MKPIDMNRTKSLIITIVWHVRRRHFVTCAHNHITIIIMTVNSLISKKKQQQLIPQTTRILMSNVINFVEMWNNSKASLFQWIVSNSIVSNRNDASPLRKCNKTSSSASAKNKISVSYGISGKSCIRNH